MPSSVIASVSTREDSETTPLAVRCGCCIGTRTARTRNPRSVGCGVNDIYLPSLSRRSRDDTVRGYRASRVRALPHGIPTLLPTEVLRSDLGNGVKVGAGSGDRASPSARGWRTNRGGPFLMGVIAPQ